MYDVPANHGGAAAVALADAVTEAVAAALEDVDGECAPLADGDDCGVALGEGLAEVLADAELDGGSGAPATLARRTWLVDAWLLPK